MFTQHFTQTHPSLHLQVQHNLYPNSIREKILNTNGTVVLIPKFNKQLFNTTVFPSHRFSVFNVRIKWTILSDPEPESKILLCLLVCGT